MNTFRAFIAVEIDGRARQKISELISNLKKSGADAKWITENQMHLTLKFLGNISEEDIQKISDALSGVSNNFNSFMINFSRIGAFPNLDHPAVLWLGVDKGADYLKTLAGEIENALEKSGFAREAREFQPHLTLARIKSPKNMPELARLARKTDFISGDVQINKLVLFKSRLSPKGAIYTIILEKLLQNMNAMPD